MAFPCQPYCYTFINVIKSFVPSSFNLTINNHIINRSVITHDSVI
jgi:hypothetical protein